LRAKSQPKYAPINQICPPHEVFERVPGTFATLALNFGTMRVRGQRHKIRCWKLDFHGGQKVFARRRYLLEA
jgi:hypothetical protein